MMEVQITKEYLGFGTHLAYLGTMWSEVLAQPHWPRPQSTAHRVRGFARRPWPASRTSAPTATGPDRNSTRRTGTPSAAWPGTPDVPPAIADEWARMTWSNDPRFVKPVVAMMMGSRQAVVDYMTPLGLAHQMATDHHYGPGPWVTRPAAPQWNPAYYHRADASGIGFDRTATGSNAVAQYAPDVAAASRT